MTPEERSRLESIETVLRSDNVREQIRPIVERVRAELGRKKEALMAWEPIPLTAFGGALPPEIRSAWVFVLRAGADTGPERHPNSHQRMMTFGGSGDMQTGEPGRWQSNVLVSNPEVPPGMPVDFDPAECLASPGGRPGRGLGGCFVSHRRARGID
jgi:hypothetical protein